MSGWIVAFGQKTARGFWRLAEVLLDPECRPQVFDDDLMAVADATREPDTSLDTDTERADYHDASCAAVEIMADRRAPLTPIDLTIWDAEYRAWILAGGEVR